MVSLAPGEEKGTLDFQLQRVPIARVEGTVVNPTGQPMANIQLTIVGSTNALPGIDTVSTRAQAEGRFTFNNIAPGQYVIVAQTQGTGGPPPPGQSRVTVVRPEPPRYWAMTPVAIDGRNLSNVILSLQGGMTLSGTVKFDATTLQAPADLTRVRLNLSPVESESSLVTQAMRSSATGRVEANGRFTLTGVVPGVYRLTGSSPSPGWFLESAVVEGQNTLDIPSEIKPSQNLTGATVTFADRQAEVRGTVTNLRGQPAPDCTVLVFPSEPPLWLPNSVRIRTTRPATDGGFTFTGLAPGEYGIVPLGDIEPGSWFDPAVLQQLDAGAERLTLNDGEKKVQDLKFASGGL